MCVRILRYHRPRDKFSNSFTISRYTTRDFSGFFAIYRNVANLEEIPDRRNLKDILLNPQAYKMASSWTENVNNQYLYSTTSPKNDKWFG